MVQWIESICQCRGRGFDPGLTVSATAHSGAAKPTWRNYSLPLEPRPAATEPTGHSFWARAPEASKAQLLSLSASTTEARAPSACTPRQEKPPQWEAWTPQLEKAHTQPQRPGTTKNINKIIPCTTTTEPSYNRILTNTSPKNKCLKHRTINNYLLWSSIAELLTSNLHRVGGSKFSFLG